MFVVRRRPLGLRRTIRRRRRGTASADRATLSRIYTYVRARPSTWRYYYNPYAFRYGDNAYIVRNRMRARYAGRIAWSRRY